MQSGRKLYEGGSGTLKCNGIGGLADPQGRAGFTSAIVAAIKELQVKKPPDATELGQRAYQKLQYDLPLVSSEEIDALTDTLRASLQLKAGQPPFPVTSKLLENVISGARAPVSIAPGLLQAQGPSSATCRSHPVAATAHEGSAAPQPAADPNVGMVAQCSNMSPNGSDGPSTAAAPEPLVFSLTDTDLNPDLQRLCSSFRALCAVVFVQLVSHSLAVSEHDTWGLLYAIGSDEEEDAQGSDAAACQRGSAGQGGAADAALESRSAEAENGPAELVSPNASTSAWTANYSSWPQHTPAPVNGSDAAHAGGLQRSIADQNGLFPMAPDPPPDCTGNEPLGHPRGQQQHQSDVVHDEPRAAEEDGDDFVFEDLEPPCNRSSASNAAAATATRAWVRRHPTSSPPSPPPYSWRALRARLLRLAGHVSYALLDDPCLWRDGELLQGVFQLLRALGAHRHSQELQPLLHAYVGLVADRIAAEPSELACLDNLWDAVGLQCVASLRQVGRHRTGGAGDGRGADRGQGVLLAEATTCLSLVATLAGQLTGSSAKLRLWQQVHKHMLPLLERCLGELAWTVTTGPAAAKPRAAAAHEQPPQAEPRGPGPEEVAAIVLVCQVLDFYVQQRPGNADLAAALKGTGVLASLSVLFAAAAALPGAEPLRSAALCCAASSRELHTWVLAVPGVAKTLAGPSFQEGGAHEAHGAVWQLLGNGGSSPLALSILAGGAAPEKAVRLYALLQLLAKAAACRGTCEGGCGGVWGTIVERSMRDVYSALRQEQAGGPAAASGRAADGGEKLGRVADGLPVGVGGAGDGGAGVRSQLEEDGDDDEDKLHLLGPEALQQRRARQLHPACWRILKQLLTRSGESCGKTD